MLYASLQRLIRLTVAIYEYISLSIALASFFWAKIYNKADAPKYILIQKENSAVNTIIYHPIYLHRPT